MGCGKISKTKVVTVKPSKNKHFFIEDIDDVKNETASKRQSIHINIIQKADSMLQVAKTNSEKALVYNMKGDYYFYFANTMRCKRNLDYFIIYRKSMSMFKIACEFDGSNLRSVMGIANCLVNLHQYKKAIKHLEKNSKPMNLFEYKEYWALMGICRLKRAKIWNGKSKLSLKSENLKKAAECLDKAIELKSSDKKIFREKQVVESLLSIQSDNNGDIYKYFESMKMNSHSYEISPIRHRPDKEFYKILAVDGGGLKGILPTMILCEIEKLCRTYLSNMFNMFAGTSTGGFVAMTCCVPKEIGSTIPLYTMGDLLKVYIDDGSNIIFRDPSCLGLLFSQKFSNKGLFEVNKKYYSDYRLSQVMNDLIVPAVNCDGPIRTEYFTSYDARRLKDKDMRLVDVIMATTAAPTIFSPYKIKGLGCFIDGGLTTQNPAKKAYEEALYRFKKAKDEIFVLSLGTGVHASTMFEENFGIRKNFLHWTQKIPEYIITGQIHNTENYLNEQLGMRHRRFQVYFEDNIPFDVYSYSNDLLNIGSEYVEDQHDNINKVVEILLEH